MRRWSIPLGIVSCALALGCHHEVEMIPLAERTIYLTDRFYDVQAVDKNRAVVVGYGGKILDTADGGRNWTLRTSGTDLALYGVRMVDDQHGWIVGQDGLILHTEDGGKTWTPQESNATFLESDGAEKRAYLFNVDAVDANTAWAVGDRSTLVSTTDGGKTWRSRKVAMDTDLSGGVSLAAADPIFYDVKFADAKTGWIVGEFGKVLKTTDGGETWREQTKSLMDSSNGEYVDLLDLPTLFGVYASDTTHAVASGLEAHVARTEDGTNWAYQKTDGAGVPLLDPLYSVAMLPDGSGWSIGAAGQVVKYDPAAQVWKRAPIGQDVLTWLRAVDFSDDRNGYMVGGFGLIFRTTDGGKTWLPSQG
jgi:photosystem II stability/assembly factor-like uncharacterized protein